MKFTDEIDRSQLNNGILVLWDEAKKRNLKIFNIKIGRLFNNKKYYFDRNPIDLVAQQLNHFSDASQYE